MQRCTMIHLHAVGTTSLVDNSIVHIESTTTEEALESTKSKDMEDIQNVTTNIGFTTKNSETDVDFLFNKKVVDLTSDNSEDKWQQEAMLHLGLNILTPDESDSEPENDLPTCSFVRLMDVYRCGLAMLKTTCLTSMKSIPVEKS